MLLADLSFSVTKKGQKKTELKPTKIFLVQSHSKTPIKFHFQQLVDLFLHTNETLQNPNSVSYVSFIFWETRQERKPSLVKTPKRYFIQLFLFLATIASTSSTISQCTTVNYLSELTNSLKAIAFSETKQRNPNKEIQSSISFPSFPRH